MRFLKTLTLNRRGLYDGRVALTTLDDLSLVESRSMVLPNSNSAISGAVAGQLRYNTTSNEVEVYQGSSLQWRAIRYKEPGLITAQNLGAGNATEVYFGPLTPAYPTVAAHNVTWDDAQKAKNIFVIVENVLQVPITNYTVVGNPTLGAETYTPTISFAAVSGSTTLYFNSAVQATGISGTGVTVTITFVPKTQTPFAIGASIVVTGFGVSGYNGTYTVTGSTSSSVSYSNVTTTATTVYGTVTSNSATVYPSANFLGSTVSGVAQIASSTTLSTVAITGAGGTFSCASTTLVVGQKVTITGTYGGTGSILGYTSGNNYYIIATNGSTTFTLSSSFNGTAITTTAGTPTGLTYTLPTNVTAVTTDPDTDALVSVTISKATITSTIAVNTAITITEGGYAGSGYYVKFSSPPPLGKIVTALIGFDQ